ncbi:PEP-CTERM sorting domain-containing protein [Massilia sp. CCM 9210]|uniref:PEP-CTERM sorting domain-containing protein n=1 Tax=Massilia scottii TaxID=3057166 RepID=UPI00279644C4|nr:PEP-CTERM sorting domain-containing protein [Massilia sp. CCM 9210]MDQ1816965.1 PEP-CTERM sorting domain-containing protein [Massilia sp. CCM 9210]
MYKFAAGVMVAVTLASPLLAHAQVRAEGSLTNFSYTLIDLLPNDGIAPSLSIVTPQGYAGGAWVSGSLRQYESVEPWFDDSRSQSTAPYSRGLNVSLDTPVGTGGASLTGTDFHSLQLRSVASTTSAPAASRQAGGYAGLNITEFVLSPGTRVSFFADFTGSASVTLPEGEVHQAYQDYAEIQAEVSLNAYGPNGPGDYVYESNFITLKAWNGHAGESPASERFSLTLDNNSAFSRNLDLKYSLHASVQAVKATVVPPSPVPEPATTAMLAAGLALVAGAVRRRRKLRGED